jgi:hypothetical protein
MRKTRLHSIDAETKRDTLLKIIPSPLLTSGGYPHYSSENHMEPKTEVTAKKVNRNKVAYPLRFKNKTQKERLERAARKARMSLRDFLLTQAEDAASRIMGGELKAS